MLKKILILLVVVIFTSCNNQNEVSIAYQGMANPWKSLIKNKSFEELTEKKIHWKKFNSGAKIINAMASGDVDIAVMGSTPLASALGKGLELKVVWVMEIIGDSEAFVVKEDINKLEDLVGKKVAVPFGSTTHYHLLLALKKKNIDIKKVEIFNLTPASIVSSWKNNQIDAAFVWAPALEEIKKTGKVLFSSKNMAEDGDPTFDAVVASNKFLKSDSGFTSKFLKLINQHHQKLNAEKWNKDSQEVKDIAAFVGAKAEDVEQSLKGYEFPEVEKQLGEKLLGGDISKALLKTSIFLKEQGKISDLQDDYSKFIDISFAKAIKQ